ncbi:apolipoprotein N-acyltransferase [Thermodesulforhabdus norvegica]|uniref:Apolipoprotein N-acyltransferase n=1 Tax=Thermodesulforhabdus norvegica TaxID=39841 RepID=A0A1I4UWK8_9BACT|nr:apolipoprotein N-acyltransferase [Thermodesulforhabdus norvegica]SFM93255.1 Apolipoprotein N-acyltransferase [Thermodesulforhabdus norvegica]
MSGQNLIRLLESPFPIILIGGVSLTLAFPPYGYSPVAWIAFIPLLCASSDRKTGVSRAAIFGFVFGLSHRLTSIYWIHYVLQKYGHLPFTLSLLLCVALCAYLAIYPAIFAIAARYLSLLNLNWLVLPCTWVLLEWIQAKALTGFPWNLVGYSQGSVLQIVQSADLWGVYGVSFAVLLINAVIAELLKKRRFSFVAALSVATVWAFIFFYGAHKIKNYGASSGTSKCFRTAIVQGNIDQAVKWDAEFRRTTLEKYLALSRNALLHSGNIELIVWPETAMPFFFELDPDFGQAIRQFAKKEGVALLFGSPGVAFKEGGEAEGFLNNAYLVDKRGITTGKYSKEHLVPFGEYVPLKKVLFFVKRLVPAAGDFIPGKTSGLLQKGGIRMGVLICYEAIFPELARKRTKAGANVLVNISNDAWFGYTSAPFQHLEMARWRAVETRRPLLRSTNTGISAFVDPLGRVEQSLDLFKEGFIDQTVCTGEEVTFYARFGDWLVLLCALTTLISMLYVRHSVKKKARRVKL